MHPSRRSPLALFLLIIGATAALRLPLHPATSRVATVSARAPVASIRCQVEAPVRIPDKAPVLSPTKPKRDGDSEKGKQFKVLLFNDNVNRCAPCRLPARHGQLELSARGGLCHAGVSTSRGCLWGLCQG